MKKLLLITLIIYSVSNLFSQVDTTQLYEITTTDGNQFIGSIIQETANEILLKTFSYGEITIKKFLITEKKATKPPRTRKEKKSEIADFEKPNEHNKDSLWRVVTNDGFDFVGTIANYDSDGIRLKTEKFGEIKILNSTISNINLVQSEEIIDGDVWFKNPQASRYFYSPNGYGLKKGEGYFQNVWVLFNQASYGLSDKFTLGVGTVPVFLFGAGVVPLWITPKFSLPIIEDKINISVGVFAGAIFGEEVAFALPYSTITFGDRNKNINIGGGFLSTTESGTGLGLLTASAMFRINKKSYLLTENYILMQEGDPIVLLSAGGRTIWPKLSLDYGLLLPIGTGSFFAIPWVGFVLPFGKK